MKHRPITRVCFVAAALWHICMLLLSQNGKKQCMEISTEDAVSDKWLSGSSIRFPSFSIVFPFYEFRRWLSHLSHLSPKWRSWIPIQVQHRVQKRPPGEVVWPWKPRNAGRLWKTRKFVDSWIPKIEWMEKNRIKSTEMAASSLHAALARSTSVSKYSVEKRWVLTSSLWAQPVQDLGLILCI